MTPPSSAEGATGAAPSAGTPPSAPSAPGAPPAAPPGTDTPDAPRRRRLLLPALAFGCAMLLLLGLGGGVTALWLTAPDSGTATDRTTTSIADEPTENAGTWHPLEPGHSPAGSAEQLDQVLAENPLLGAQLAEPDECTLPATEGGAVPAEELAGYLRAGADCLAGAWTDALAPEGIDFDPPEIVVFTTEDLPEEAGCDPGRFSDFAPVVCHGDNTLYWPAQWDPGFSHTSAEETPQLYMWHLSYTYTAFALSAASLDGYYGALQLALAQQPDRADEVQRRWALQLSCLSSAATFRMPDGVRPDGRVADFVTSREAQAAPATPGEPSPAARAQWVRAGRDSGGELDACGTWTAPADAVT